MTRNFAYKTIPDGMISNGHKWKVGKWYEVKGPVVLCETGFHASKLLPDCFGFVRPGYVCKVEYGGEVIHGTDKLVASRMRVLWAVNWGKNDSLLFVLSLEKRLLKINDSQVVRDCFSCVRAVLEHDTEANRKKARKAADAARDACAARDSEVAWAATGAGRAAGSGRAALAVARDATWAAWASWAAAGASWASEKLSQHRAILRIINDKRKKVIV